MTVVVVHAAVIVVAAEVVVVTEVNFIVAVFFRAAILVVAADSIGITSFFSVIVIIVGATVRVAHVACVIVFAAVIVIRAPVIPPAWLVIFGLAMEDPRAAVLIVTAKIVDVA